MFLEVLEFVFVSSVSIMLFDCIMFACFFIFLLFPFMNFRKKKKKNILETIHGNDRNSHMYFKQTVLFEERNSIETL